MVAEHEVEVDSYLRSSNKRRSESPRVISVPLLLRIVVRRVTDDRDSAHGLSVHPFLSRVKGELSSEKY